MLSFIQLDKPHIDIELYGTDTNIAPIDKVHIMDEDSFEQFTLEWLFGCKKSKYSSIKRIGGAGDKGRDVVGYYSDGTVDYYQCKHYNTGLAPTNYYLELGKLCYYTYKKEIPIPKEYFIIASNDVGSSLQDLIDKSFLDYIRSFDFTIIKTYPIAQVIDEYLDTIYGNIRFGGRRLSLPTTLTPTDTVESEEMPYISALLEAYSDELNIKIDTIKSLEAYSSYFKHLNRQRKDYYSAETIRRFVRDTLTDSQQFDVLKEEIYNGIIDTHEQEYDSGYKRLVEDLKQAAVTNTSKSMLDSKLHCIGNSERKGVCHMLVNDNKLRWVNEE